jgi:hypothetical protein
MKWSNLIAFLVAALGIGTLCCCAPHSFGSGLRNIRNAMDSWPRASFLALDVFAVLLVALSNFLYRARNWARLILMGGCICYTVLALVGGVLLCVEDANIVDGVFIAGVLIWSIAGPLLLVFILRQPEVIKEFGGRMR